MDKQVDISGLEKAGVLAALYNATHAQGMGWLHFTPEDMTKEQAQAILDERHEQQADMAAKFPGSVNTHSLFFDYLHGRVMKVDLMGDTFSPFLYDRDNYEGAAAEVIAKLRARLEVEQAA